VTVSDLHNLIQACKKLKPHQGYQRSKSFTQWRPDRAVYRSEWGPGWTWQSVCAEWHDGDHSRK